MNNRIGIAAAVVMKAKDRTAPVEEWEPVKQEDVPDEVKDLDVMGRLLEDPGLIAEVDGACYRVIKDHSMSEVPLESISPD